MSNVLNCKSIESIPRTDMGTEYVSMVLYSLIRSIKPKRIVEIGSGYSTYFLSNAIKDNEQEDPQYQANYTIIDNGEDHQANCTFYIDEITKLKLRSSLNVINNDLFHLIKNNKINDQYDFVWLDVGTGEEYPLLFETFMSRCVPGGILTMHSTVSNVYGRLFLAEAEMLNRTNPSFEMISFVEEHKDIQDSYTIFKKKCRYPIKSIYT